MGIQQTIFMNKEELWYFVKYLIMSFGGEFEKILKGLRKLARPRFWIMIFSIILIYQIWVGGKWKIFFTLFVMVFIWIWDTWENGHWKGNMRQERKKRLKEKYKT